MEDCIIDFVVFPNPNGDTNTRRKVMVIELNPYGEKTGAALFSWVDDRKILYYGPFQFRVIKDIEIQRQILKMDR